MRARLLSLLAILFAAGPIVASLVRYRQTNGADARMIWMALVALVGAAVVMRLGRASARGISTPALAFVVATALASITAVLLGGRALPGVIMVSVVLSAFWVISFVLWGMRDTRPDIRHVTRGEGP